MFKAGIWLLAGLLVFAAARQSRAAERDEPMRRYSKTARETLPWSATQTIVVSEAGGLINITGVDEETVKLKGIRSCYHMDMEQAREHVQDVLMQVESRTGVLSIKTRRPAVWAPGFSGKIDYTLHTPATASLTLETVSGDIMLHSLQGAVQARTMQGGITAVSGAAELRLSTLSGDIRARHTEGAVEFETATGAVDLSLESLKSDDLRITTMSGSVTIVLEEDLDAVFDLATLMGTLSTPALERDETPDAAARMLTHTMGKGGHRIIVRTLSGDITVERPPEKHDRPRRRR